MTSNGLKEMLLTFRRVVEGELEMQPEAINNLMLGGVIAVLEEVRGLGRKIDAQDNSTKAQAKQITKIDRRLIAVGIMAGLALAAIATHTGWTWLAAAAVP
jgi:hypothetical protein